MSNVVIEVSELRSFDDECIKELTDFLEEKLKGKIVANKKQVTLEFEEGEKVSRSCLRLILRKFLNRANLREEFRVISGGENIFIMKEKKVYEE
jgi:hypothetical protein